MTMTLPGDKQLLELLARDVMGWKLERRLDVGTDTYTVHKYGPLQLYNAPYRSLEHEGWNPLEDIADAWMLAEALGLTVTPTYEHGESAWGCAHCNWHRSGETTAVGMTNHQDWFTAPTAPRAICLAAYAWYRERQPKIPRGFISTEG